jgi:apolipoprotein D and lipocalin family protein
LPREKRFKMGIYTKYLFAISLLIVLVQAQIPSFGGCPEIPAVKNFDKEQFLGTWYEIERYFTVAEVAARCVSATYEKRPDGKVYINNAFTNRFTGVQRIISGTMKLTGKEDEGLFNVRYSGLPIAYDTVLKVLDTDYESFAVIWSCSGVAPFGHTESVWVMARERVPSGPVLQKIYGVLDKYKISRTFFVESDQKNCETLPLPLEAIDPTEPPIKKTTNKKSPAAIKTTIEIESTNGNVHEEDDDVAYERSAPEVFAALKAYHRAKANPTVVEAIDTPNVQSEVESEKVLQKTVLLETAVVQETVQTVPSVDVPVVPSEKTVLIEEAVIPAFETTIPVVVVDSTLTPELSVKALITSDVVKPEIEPEIVAVKAEVIPEPTIALKTIVNDESTHVAEATDAKTVAETVALVGATKSGIAREKIQQENPIEPIIPVENPVASVKTVSEPETIVTVNVGSTNENVEVPETLPAVKIVTPSLETVESTKPSDTGVTVALDSVSTIKTVPEVEAVVVQPETVEAIKSVPETVIAIKSVPETVDIVEVHKPESVVAVKSIDTLTPESQAEPVVSFKSVPESEASVSIKSVKVKEQATEHKKLTKKLVSMRKVVEKTEGVHEIPVQIVSS